MNKKFNSQLSVLRVQAAGIRSFSEIEDSFFDPNRRSYLLKFDKYPISRPLSKDEEIKIIQEANRLQKQDKEDR